MVGSYTPDPGSGRRRVVSTCVIICTHRRTADMVTGDPDSLDVKTGLLTGLLTGIQGWKCPVALSQTCYGSKSLKVILMDSNFGGHPVLNPLVTL